MSTTPMHAATGATLSEAAYQAWHAAALHLELELHRPSAQDSWQAELRAHDGTAPLQFASLPALIGFIARLDRPTHTPGLR